MDGEPVLDVRSPDVARVFYPPPPAEATALAASADRYEPLSVGAALHRNVRGPPLDQFIESGKGAGYPLRRFPGSYPLAGVGD